MRSRAGSFAFGITVCKPMAAARDSSPRLTSCSARPLHLRPTPLCASLGKISCVVLPALTPASAPTANAACFAWSVPSDPPPAPEAHEALPTSPDDPRPAEHTLLLCPPAATPQSLSTTPSASTFATALSIPTSTIAPAARSIATAHSSPHTTRLQRTIHIRGGTRGLVQHVVSVGAPVSYELPRLRSCAYGNNPMCYGNNPMCYADKEMPTSEGPEGV
jgi:hypothetical protein